MLLHEKHLIEASMNEAKCKTQLFQVFQNDQMNLESIILQVFIVLPVRENP